MTLRFRFSKYAQQCFEVFKDVEFEGQAEHQVENYNNRVCW